MATPEVKVRISADKDSLESGLGGARRSLSDFAGSIPLIGAAVAAAGAAIGAFAKSAIDEAAKAELGMIRLSTAVGNSGNSFTLMKGPLEDAVRSVMKVSTATDDDLNEALTRMITISGDVEGSMKNLGLVTDVAAFKQIDLSAAADAVGKAMDGNTGALKKMGFAGEDATAVIEAARTSLAGYAEGEAKTFSGALDRINNQWGEFKEAVGAAILSGGDASAMADGLAGILGNLVLWVEKNEDAFLLVRDVVGGFVGALYDVGKAIYEAVQPALGPVFTVLIGALLVLLQGATFGVQFLAGTFKALAGDTLQALGTLVEKGGALLKVFGVDVVKEAGTSIKDFGAAMSLSATGSVKEATKTYKDGMKAIMAGRVRSNDETEREEKRSQGEVTEIHGRGQTERMTKAQQAAADHQSLMETANKIFEDTVNKIQRPALVDMAVDWKKVDEAALKVTGTIKLSAQEQKELGAETKTVGERMEDVAREAEAAEDKFRENVDAAHALGEELIGAGQEMGAVSDEAATALSSVLEMGANIAKFGLGSPEGILSIISGLATLIGGWGSSPAEQARKTAMMSNTRAVEELNQSFDEYNLGVSGRSFSGILGVLEKLDIEGPTTGNIQTEGVKFLLKQAGISFADAEKLAEKYNIDLKAPGGWNALLAVLRTRKYGSPEGNFTDELSSLTESFDVLGVDDEDDKLQAFSAFVDKNIPGMKGALGDLSTAAGRTAAIGKLKQLYQDSISGKLTPADYGNASPQQFRQIIAALLPLLGAADGTLGSGAAVGSASGARAPSPFGGAPGLGSPVPIGVFPSPGGGIVGGGIADGFSLGGSIGTQIQGNVNITVVQEDDEDGEALAHRIAQLLGATYNLQRAAQGLPT